jgi:hypothetical protein
MLHTHIIHIYTNIKFAEKILLTRIKLKFLHNYYNLIWIKRVLKFKFGFCLEFVHCYLLSIFTSPSFNFQFNGSGDDMQQEDFAGNLVIVPLPQVIPFFHEQLDMIKHILS